MRVEMRLFRHITHPGFVRNQIMVDAAAIEKDLARRGLEQSGDHFDGRGFPGAVGAEIPGHFAGTRSETDIIDCRNPGKAFADVAKFQHVVTYIAGRYRTSRNFQRGYSPLLPVFSDENWELRIGQIN